MSVTESAIRQIQQLLSQDSPAAAEKAARAALERSPGDAALLHLLGVALIQTQRFVDAEAALRESVQIDPRQFAAQSALAVSLRKQRRFADAVAPMRRAVDLAPDNIDLAFTLADTMKEAGMASDAIAVVQHIIQKAPQNASAYNALGLLHSNAGDYTAAMLALEHCISLSPRRHDAYVNLGNVLRRLHRLEDAELALKRAIAINPNYPPGHANLGLVYKDMGRFSEAETCYLTALKLDPKMTGVYTNLGVVLAELKQYDAAEEAYKKAPRLPPTLTNWGNLLRLRGQITDSVGFLQQAVSMDPTYAEALNNLAISLQIARRVEDSSKCFARLLTLRPDDQAAASNYLMSLNYIDRFTPESIFEEHRRFGVKFDRSAGLIKTIDPSPRRLRIAYLSPDFRNHSVAWFIESILQSHDRTQFEVVCYVDVRSPDATTARLKNLVEHWIPVHTLSEEQLVNRIIDDRIDILVDLAGHTSGNRLGVFAHKPAALQVTYLGYPNTTGLPAMDYRLTDEIADPPGLADTLHVEKLYRLPRAFLCYKPPIFMPDVSPPPAAESDVITFGSFNNVAKLSDSSLTLWAKVLNRVEHSRLLLKAPNLGDVGLQKSITHQFAAHGISADRVVFRDYEPSFQAHLGAYGHVDIALDPLPYNGTTTTIEALLMGVPVVTVAGRTHVSRVGASILSAMQMNECIAADADQFVELASVLASDRVKLGELRAGLRERLLKSPLVDAAGFTRELENAYRVLWQARLRS